MGSSWEQDWCDYHMFREPESLFSCSGRPDFACLVGALTSPCICRASTKVLCKYDPVTASRAAAVVIASRLGKSPCSFEVSSNPVAHRLCTKVVVGEHLVPSVLYLLQVQHTSSLDEKVSWPRLRDPSFSLNQIRISIRAGLSSLLGLQDPPVGFS